MSIQLFDLKDKIALVTGSTQGIGLAIAKGLAEANAQVIIHGRTKEKIDRVADSLKVQGISVFSSCFDVKDEDEIRAEASRIESKVGVVDILVNNAGIVKRTPLVETKLVDWNDVVATDLTSAFLVSKYFVPGMIAKKRGKVINMCSLMSEVGRKTVSSYAAAKGGMKTLSRSMADEWAEYNIQVNGIGPGFIATPMNAVHRAPGNPFNDFVIRRTPAGKWGVPEDIIGTAIFLASAASDFVTGQIIYPDGGMLATLGKPTEK